MVADHAIIVLSPSRPNGQKTRGFVVKQTTLYDDIDFLWRNDLQQGEGGAINIPIR
jgi:hypothetical protein